MIDHRVYSYGYLAIVSISRRKKITKKEKNRDTASLETNIDAFLTQFLAAEEEEARKIKSDDHLQHQIAI